MKKTSTNNKFIYYADLLKKYDNNIDIRKNGNNDVILFNNTEYIISNEEEYISIIRRIVNLKTPQNKEELFKDCTKLFNFIVKNKNYKSIIDKVLTNSIDFKNLFAMAIYINNSADIFNDVREKQLKKINYNNINTILSNFIVEHNNQELSNMELLENQKSNLEEKLFRVKESINSLNLEKDKKDKYMEEKTATMKFYVEFKNLISSVKNIDLDIKKNDGEKLEFDINSIRLLQQMDNIKVQKQQVEKNIILKILNRKRISEYELKINNLINKIKENNSLSSSLKKKIKQLNEDKKHQILNFCNNYNESMINSNIKLTSFEDIKMQFDKIKSYDSFKDDKQLITLIEKQTELKMNIEEINKNTKYKDKFYLLYQIKTVCEIMNIPYEEVINEKLIKIVEGKKGNNKKSISFTKPSVKGYEDIVLEEKKTVKAA